MENPRRPQAITPDQWDTEEVAGASAARDAGDIAALSRRPDNKEVWWFGRPDSPAQGKFWYDDGRDWQPAAPYRVPGDRASTDSGIAAVSRHKDTMEAWWIGKDDGFVRGAFWYEDGRGWQAYPDPVGQPLHKASNASGIAALSRHDKNLEIWWVGDDGLVRGAGWYDDATPTWDAYFMPTDRRASKSSGLAAVSRSENTMEVWWIGPNGSVEGAYWYDDGSSWHQYGAPVAPDNSAKQGHCITAVSRTDKSMDLVWITPQGGIRWAYWKEGSKWALHPDLVVADGKASTVAGIAAISRTADSFEIYWITPERKVQGAFWVDGAGWTVYDNPVADKASLSSGVVATSRTATTTELFWIGMDGSVQHAVRSDETRPVRFRILRPADMVDLWVDAVGCRRVAGTASALQHRVVGGETLWDIAYRYYADGSLYTLIAAANHLGDPDLIRVGDVLVIPPRPPAAPPADVYIVTGEDTLWDIADRFYGDPLKYHLIAEANNLADPNHIVPGQRLVIPKLEGTAIDSYLEGVDAKAHLVVHFGFQNIYEQRYNNPPGNPSGVAGSRAANGSRVVFELPDNAKIPYTASGILAALTKFGLRVAPLAIPKVDGDDKRPNEAKGGPRAPEADETAIEAPYRLVVSPDQKYGGFTHAADAAIAPGDTSRVELWHSRLGVRTVDPDGNPVVDEQDRELAKKRTVRAIWNRDRELPETSDPSFPGSLSRDYRNLIVRQSADPGRAEPEPLSVDRLHLSSLGAWIDWQARWNIKLYNGAKLEAYRHIATLGRDQYVRVETPVFCVPWGHRGTRVEITERKIPVDGDNSAAYLNYRHFIVWRERTREYKYEDTRDLPFTSVSIDPVVSPDLDPLTPAEEKAPFVPHVGNASYQWKITGVDHAGRLIPFTTALIVVPMNDEAYKTALTEWDDKVVKKEHPIDAGDVEVAFAPETRSGDTTHRLKYVQFRGTVSKDTCKPNMLNAGINVPALTALNRGGTPVKVKYRGDFVAKGFANDPYAELYLLLTDEEAKLNFAGGSDRGGGFVEPSISVTALSRKYGAVGDNGQSGDGILDGKFDPATFLGSSLPKLFGLLELKEILQTAAEGADLADAPKLIGEQLGFIAAVGNEFANMKHALQKTLDTVQDDRNKAVTPQAKRVFDQLLSVAEPARDALTDQLLTDLLGALAEVRPDGGANPAVDAARNIQTALEKTRTLFTDPNLAAFLKGYTERSYRTLSALMDTAKDGADLLKALSSPVENGAIRYDWFAKIKGWPEGAHIFEPRDPKGLAISVEVRTAKDGTPQSDVSAQLRDFSLKLLPGDDALMEMKFSRVGFRVGTGGKPEVDVLFDGMEFLGVLGFIEKLRQIIPFDGFADPPYVDVNENGATAGFSLALPSVAIGVFSLENIALGADCRVPFLGEAVTVGFNFCTKEAPFRLTVLAIGGGGWVGIRLAPRGLVLLEMGLEAGASLSIDLGVASGSVSVMIGVYLRLEDKKGQLTGYFRIRGEVEVLGIASASITLELSLTYHFDSGKLIGRATLTVEVEVAFFSASVEITCERQLAGSRGDPHLIDIMPPDDGGRDLWDQYYDSFAIGA